MAASMHTVDVTDQTFQEVVVEGSKERPVVVDMWAEWCGPCRTLGPILEKIADERAGAFLLAKLDTDANQMTAASFGVQSIPTVIAFKDGKPVDGFIGAYPEPEVNRFPWLELRVWPRAGYGRVLIRADEQLLAD